MIPLHGRAVVLGGLGFIGTNLACTLLDRGWAVTVIDPVRSSVRGVRERVEEIGDRAIILRQGMESANSLENVLAEADVVFDVAGSTGHLASIEDPLQDLDSNLIAHAQYLQWMKQFRPDIPLVLASTRQVLGNSDEGVLSDRTVPRPLDVNGVSKLALEGCLRVFGSTWGLQSVALRLPNIYGPHMRVADASMGVIGGWVGQALLGETLSVYGSGAARRNVLHIDDAVDAMIAAVSLADHGGQVYLVGGESMSLLDIAESIALHASVQVSHADMPMELRAIALGSALIDDSPFRAITAWSPSVCFDDGIVDCMQFYRERRHLYVA
jgi:nucleoside-diphosphate-sugar epimerase